MVHKGNLRVPTESAVLVVGAGGMIGSALQTTLTSRGIPTVGTTRTGNGGPILLDLLAEPATWRIPDFIATAVLCAAITSTKACRERSAEARRVNVDATVALGRLLAGRGCRIVFLSTNMVFDGSVPFVPADTPTCPRTSYGVLKAEAERELLALGVDRSLVQPTLATAHRHDLEHVPRYTTLDAARARDALGLPPPNPWTALEEYTS